VGRLPRRPTAAMSVPLELWTVGPQLAAVWLAASGQDKIKPEKVALFAAVIRDGRWYPERHRDDPVKFYDGRLINGNHRLHAVVDCGMPAGLWVLGVPPEREE
jgi:hypothetical protein